MATNGRRCCGVQLSAVLLVLLRSSSATAAAAASSTAPTAKAKGIHSDTGDGDAVAAASCPRLSTLQQSKEEAGMEVFDFSFSRSDPYVMMPPEDSVEENSPPVRALSLRECSLGDAGLVEVAASPWVRGKSAVRVLSLRSNQVRSTTSTTAQQSTSMIIHTIHA